MQIYAFKHDQHSEVTNMSTATVTIVLISALALAIPAQVTTKEDPKPASADLRTSVDDQGNMKNDNSSDLPDLLAIMDKCNETFRIDMAYLEALDESGSFSDETDRTPKCYLRCVLESIGVASEDGQFDPETTAVMFAGERGGKEMNDIQKMAATCAGDRKESCKCERSYQFMKCLMESEINEYLTIM